MAVYGGAWVAGGSGGSGGRAVAWVESDWVAGIGDWEWVGGWGTLIIRCVIFGMGLRRLRINATVVGNGSSVANVTRRAGRAVRVVA